MTTHGHRYNQDFYAWTQEQATLLKEKRFTDLDVDNLVEEVESLGKRDKRELLSRMRVVLTHLLKWHYAPQREIGWQITIDDQREHLQAVLADSPSLRPLAREALSTRYQKARRRAALETQLPLDHFPATCPWTIEEVLEGNSL